MRRASNRMPRTLKREKDAHNEKHSRTKVQCRHHIPSGSSTYTHQGTLTLPRPIHPPHTHIQTLTRWLAGSHCHPNATRGLSTSGAVRVSPPPSRPSAAHTHANHHGDDRLCCGGGCDCGGGCNGCGGKLCHDSDDGGSADVDDGLFIACAVSACASIADSRKRRNESPPMSSSQRAHAAAKSAGSAVAD